MEVASLILASIGFIAIVGTICVGLYFMFRAINIHFKRWSVLKIKSMRLSNEYGESNALCERYEAGMKKLEFSKQYLEFLKEMITATVTLEFKTFKDSRIVGKITQEHLKNFIKETAGKIKLSINNDDDIGHLIYSSTYCDRFIVENIISVTKILMEFEVDKEEQIAWDQLNF